MNRLGAFIVSTLLLTAALLVSSCGQLGATAPPQLPSNVTAVSQTAISAAANAFDAALYGLDFAMDSGKIVPGSDQAKQLAAIGRKVQAALNAANAAVKAGNSATAAEALANANTAISEFKALLPGRATSMRGPPLTPDGRERILALAA
jgi:hypothetical protein